MADKEEKGEQGGDKDDSSAVSESGDDDVDGEEDEGGGKNGGKRGGGAGRRKRKQQRWRLQSAGCEPLRVCPHDVVSHALSELRVGLWAKRAMEPAANVQRRNA